MHACPGIAISKTKIQIQVQSELVKQQIVTHLVSYDRKP